MTKQVQIIDYGLGNLFSIQQACQTAGLEAFVSAESEDLTKADAIILPGVGAFGRAMECLQSLNFIDPLKEAVASGKPLMGICLGMQLLFDSSEEFGEHPGLGLVPGKIIRLPDQIDEQGRRLRVPNVGWNRVEFDEAGQGSMSASVPSGTHMYFVHSFYAAPTHEADWLMRTTYGSICYCCATQRDNILGVQFHPEKSGPLGLQLYQNWANSI